jgi:hypothetical protein
MVNFDILNKPIQCDVRKYNIKISQRNVTAEDLAKIEVLIKLSCPEAKLLEEQYNKFCIELSRSRQILNDPTTQEV